MVWKRVIRDSFALLRRAYAPIINVVVPLAAILVVVSDIICFFYQINQHDLDISKLKVVNLYVIWMTTPFLISWYFYNRKQPWMVLFRIRYTIPLADVPLYTNYGEVPPPPAKPGNLQSWSEYHTLCEKIRYKAKQRLERAE